MVALLAGVFLTLAVLPPPIAVTGSVGSALGAGLRRAFGVGVAAIPLIPLCWAVALFGHFERVTPRRLTLLLAGLAVTVPFTLAVIFQYSDPLVRDGIEHGAMYPDVPVWIGLIGAFLAFGLRFIGPVGEGLVALGAFSVLTIVTVGWNPLGRLQKTDRRADGQ